MSGDAQEPRIYPCDECDTMRTKSEGGTTFTVCDACWDRLHPPRSAGDVSTKSLAICDVALSLREDGASVEMFVGDHRRVGFSIGRDGREHWWIATMPPSPIDGSGTIGDGPGELTTGEVISRATRPPSTRSK